MTNFPTNLSILRRQAGYTQESLAEALGVSRQAVSKWESGQTLPEAATLLMLADLLDCTLDQLMRESLNGEPPPTPEERSAMNEEARYALFVEYDRHMDSFSKKIALGVFGVFLGISLMCFFLVGGSGEATAPAIAVFFLCLGAAVFSLVSGGMDHDAFQKAHPSLPEFYNPEAVAQFQRIFRRWMPAAIAAILGAVGLLCVTALLFEHDESVLLFGTSVFLLLLGAATSIIVYLGVQHSKYNYGKEG